MAESLEKTNIRKTPGVCGGDACIGNRRIMVWLLVAYRELGCSDERIMNMFDPPLCRSELDAAWEYYVGNKAEIDRNIYENEHDEEDFEYNSDGGKPMENSQTLEKTV